MNASELRKIKLFNRYGDDIRLEEVEKGKFALRGTDGSIRVIYNDMEKDEIHAVDPSGGPFLAIGDHVDEMTITKICHDKDLKCFVLFVEHKK